MNPVKSLLLVFYWLLRIAVVFVVYTRFIGIVENLNTSSVIFFIGAAYILFSLLLFFGGFSGKHTMTVSSGLVIAGLSVYQIVQMGLDVNNALSFYFLLAVIGLVFTGTGNKK